jgi:hypothetical protein
MASRRVNLPGIFLETLIYRAVTSGFMERSLSSSVKIELEW